MPRRLAFTATCYCVTAGLCLAGCATVAEKTSALFSSDTPAIGAIDGRVLWGKANFTTAHEATVHINSADVPSLACSGSLRFTGSSGGTVSLSCSDGRTIAAPFQSFTALTGAGSSQTGGTTFGFTYGMSTGKASGYLALPQDRLVAPAAAQ